MITLQPILLTASMEQCCLLSMDMRWVGNEQGVYHALDHVPCRRPVQPKVASRLHSLLVLLLVNVGAGACVSLAYAMSAEAQVTGDEGYMPWHVRGLAQRLECGRRLCKRQQRLSSCRCHQGRTLPCLLEMLPGLRLRRSLPSSQR